MCWKMVPNHVTEQTNDRGSWTGLGIQLGWSVHLCLISVIKIYGSHITEAQGKYTPSRPINKLVPNHTLYSMKLLEHSTVDQDKSKVRNKYERDKQWANPLCPQNFLFQFICSTGKPTWAQLKWAVWPCNMQRFSCVHYRQAYFKKRSFQKK